MHKKSIYKLTGEVWLWGYNTKAAILKRREYIKGTRLDLVSKFWYNHCMPLEDLKFGSKKNREPKKLTLDRPDGPKEVPDVPFRYYGEKRVDIKKAKELLEKYLTKVPDAKWVELKDHFDSLTIDFSEKDKAAFNAHFKKLKKVQVLREKIVEKSNPAFNNVALYIHEELHKNKNMSYKDIINSYFNKHRDEPVLADVTDEVLKKLEEVFPKIQSRYQNSIE